MYRGSRKHILDWTTRNDFLLQFSDLIGLSECVVTSPPVWKPKGYEQPEEARLDKCGRQFMPDCNCWDDLASWWLIHRRGANTPNWDLVVACDLWGQPGLALVEAKAHERELDWNGKRLRTSCSRNSLENHKHIGVAIAEASGALNSIVQGVHLSRDSHYQLSNRVAHSWKLASMGVPVLLVYLGFTGDNGIVSVGPLLRDHEHWQSLMRAYTKGVLPDGFLDRWLPCGKSQMRMIIRSMAALEHSPNEASG